MKKNFLIFVCKKVYRITTQQLTMDSITCFNFIASLGVKIGQKEFTILYKDFMTTNRKTIIYKHTSITSTNLSSHSQDSVCIQVMKSGKRKGEKCGNSVSDMSITKKFCKKHIKEETKRKSKQQPINIQLTNRWTRSKQCRNHI